MPNRIKVMRIAGNAASTNSYEWVTFVTTLQHLCGPVIAKTLDLTFRSNQMIWGIGSGPFPSKH